MTLDGVPLAGFSRAALARRMAVVPQETHLAFDYTVAEVAMMGRYAHLGSFEIEGPSDVAIVDRALDSTGTLPFRDRLFATLSGGEKQRVIIGAALAQIAPGSFRLQGTFRLKRRKAVLRGPHEKDMPVASGFSRKTPATFCSMSRRRRSISATSSRSWTSCAGCTTNAASRS